MRFIQKKKSLFLRLMCFLEGDIEKVKAECEKGNANAQAQIAWRMCMNDGIPLDRPNGAKLAKKSADQGCQEGQFTYGTCLLNGLGVDENPTEAFKYFKLAADQRFGPAYQQLGDLYMEGLGCKQDEKEAEKYYKLAQDAGFNPVVAI